MSRETILLVDDRQYWIDTVMDILSNAYEIIATRDSAEARRLVAERPFALAILDQRLSANLSGIELFHELRGLQPGLRAIILTGHADVEDAVVSLQAGLVDYLSKGKSGLAAELQTRVHRALATYSTEAQFLELLRSGESATVEFKSTMRWDSRQRKVSEEIEMAVLRTVAGFFNSPLGGTLLIGVSDAGNVLGLEADCVTLGRKDRDGFETFLVNVLLGAFGRDSISLIEVDFASVQQQDVCRVRVKASPGPVYLADRKGAEDLFVRTGNSTRVLTTREAVQYCAMRWPPR
jgi:DNA-binding response OmpR family regulator